VEQASADLICDDATASGALRPADGLPTIAAGLGQVRRTKVLLMDRLLNLPFQVDSMKKVEAIIRPFKLEECSRWPCQMPALSGIPSAKCAGSAGRKDRLSVYRDRIHR